MSSINMSFKYTQICLLFSLCSGSGLPIHLVPNMRRFKEQDPEHCTNCTTEKYTEPFFLSSYEKITNNNMLCSFCILRNLGNRSHNVPRFNKRGLALHRCKSVTWKPFRRLPRTGPAGCQWCTASPPLGVGEHSTEGGDGGRGGTDETGGL